MDNTKPVWQRLKYLHTTISRAFIENRHQFLVDESILPPRQDIAEFCALLCDVGLHSTASRINPLSDELSREFEDLGQFELFRELSAKRPVNALIDMGLEERRIVELTTVEFDEERERRRHCVLRYCRRIGCVLEGMNQLINENSNHAASVSKPSGFRKSGTVYQASGLLTVKQISILIGKSVHSTRGLIQRRLSSKVLGQDAIVQFENRRKNEPRLFYQSADIHRVFRDLIEPRRTTHD